MASLTVLLQNRENVSIKGHGRRARRERQFPASNSIYEHFQDKRKAAGGSLCP
jgi:hypothetical protein